MIPKDRLAKVISIPDSFLTVSSMAGRKRLSSTARLRRRTRLERIFSCLVSDVTYTGMWPRERARAIYAGRRGQGSAAEVLVTMLSLYIR